MSRVDGSAADPSTGSSTGFSMAARGTAGAVTLMCAAAVAPHALSLKVAAGTFPPLLADWRPRVGPGTVPALLVVAAAAFVPLDRLHRLRWRTLLLLSYVTSLVWMLSLALVDGTSGISAVFENKDEYLRTARATTDVLATLHGYIARIALGPDQWPVHLAGHPPGALLFFVGLVRLRLGSGLTAGLAVVVVAATTPLAVAVTARSLGAERQVRTALPFLVLGPAAIWMAVSADAMFAAVVAWGIAALALAAVRRSTAWAVTAGLLLGYSVYLSYGLVLVAFLVAAVLLVARNWRPLLAAAAAALVVASVFTALGFSWWSALPALHARYWAGVASDRPNGYWLWADLAALLFSCGPVLGAALACGARELRGVLAHPRRHVSAALVGAAVIMVLLADASLMSKAEVERIWLPFVPWLLLSTTWLPQTWARPALIGQTMFALLVQSLLWSRW